MEVSVLTMEVLNLLSETAPANVGSSPTAVGTNAMWRHDSVWKNRQFLLPCYKS